MCSLILTAFSAVLVQVPCAFMILEITASSAAPTGWDMNDGNGFAPCTMLMLQVKTRQAAVGDIKMLKSMEDVAKSMTFWVPQPSTPLHAGRDSCNV